MMIQIIVFLINKFHDALFYQLKFNQKKRVFESVLLAFV